MSFINELHSNTNKTARTENGAVSNNSTLDPVLDFFANAGAMRGKEAKAFDLFQKAFNADPQSAIRVLFYLRDIRGGQGERSVFRYIVNQLSDEFLKKIAHYIPEYGRWDDLPLNDFTVNEIIAEQLAEDLQNLHEGKSISLLAKWLPSEKSGKAAKERAIKVAELLGWVGKPTEIEVGNGLYERKPNLAPYRRIVAKLRKHINLLESQMTNGEWDEIEFDKIPSQAHKKHTKAFFRHQEERYKEFLGAVEKGEKKINAGTLFTYQLYDKIMGTRDVNEHAAANALWSNLPDYTRGENAIVLADVSGSMSGFPMSVSVSLALYFAERNEGLFKDYFMTFESTSRLLQIHGNSLSTRMKSIEDAPWGGSTNLQSAFDAILKAAVQGHASEDEMPKILYIISDMQFDYACGGGYGGAMTNFDVAKQKYVAAGYKLPHVVFWNARATGNDAPATKYDGNVTLISGSNQSAFQYAVEGKTPMQSMLDIINSERYNKIVL